MVTNDQVKKFLRIAFPEDYVPAELSADEIKRIEELLEIVVSNIDGTSRPKKYVLGLALDFTLLAQRLSLLDKAAKTPRPKLTEDKLFSRYELIRERGNTTANTLSLSFDGKEEGIRKLEEAVVELFHGLNRSGYPSAYVYNTGQWHKYKELLLLCFRLSESARYVATLKLIEYGLSIFPEHTFFGRPTPRVRLFEKVITEYPRTSPNENGGLVLQALAHGFVAADRPHLSIIVDKVRTGSARQKRIGDIDSYQGLDLELSVEVKDVHITEENFPHQLGGFVNNILASGVLGMVFVKQIDLLPRQQLDGNGIIVLEIDDVMRIVRTWDWPKQNNALLAMLHHIAHIEQKTEATDRLLEFINLNDPSHDALVYKG